MNLYVVRHGQTEWNVKKKMQGRADIPLNKKGIEQAYIIKKNLSEYNIDMIYSSPLIRAKQTAEIINETMNIDIIYDNRLIERDYGEFEGINKSSFNYNEFWAYHKNKHYTKAENIQNFFNRVYNILDELKEKYQDKNILIVTHAGITKVIECYANGMMQDENIGPFLPDNCSVTKYVI